MSKFFKIGFLLYFIGFVVYYTTGSSFSSFWQLYCKFVLNISLLLMGIGFFSISIKKSEKAISLSAIIVFSFMSTFYLLAFLLFNFFELAINDKVGYVFVGVVSLSSAISFLIYGRKRH